MQIKKDFQGLAVEKIQWLATLGDDLIGLTCSMDAARRWGVAEKIEPFTSFESASQAVKDGRVDAFLVPRAYPRVNSFIMDAELSATNAFLMEIPPLVVGVAPDICLDNAECIYHHPATTALLSDLKMPWTEAVHASSNVEACRKLLEDSESSACVTNALCARYFGLEIVQVLREGISMPWICFRKNAGLEVS